jgi:hypothetical protein
LKKQDITGLDGISKKLIDEEKKKKDYVKDNRPPTEKNISVEEQGR